jgi:hypothetical protein
LHSQFIHLRVQPPRILRTAFTFCGFELPDQTSKYGFGSFPIQRL